MSENGNLKPDPSEQAYRLYEELEAEGARASAGLVSGSGFALVLARLAENAAALTKLSSDAMDFTLRNLRIAGRRDVVSLARQLARTEDKLERVLQEVEQLRDEAENRDSGPNPRTQTRQPANGRGSRPNARENPRSDTRQAGNGRATPAPARRRKT